MSVVMYYLVIMASWWFLFGTGPADVTLTTPEAATGWQAWMAAQGTDRTPPAGSLPLPDGPLLFVAQTALFWMIRSGDGMARLMPALCGSALILVPWLFRKQLGPIGALAASTLIALDPRFVALSRSATGESAALLLSLLSAACLLRAPRYFPVMCGLLLTTGSYAWSFLPLLAMLAWLNRARFSRSKLVPLLAGCGVTLLVVSTGFFTQSEGPGLLSAGLTRWIHQWSAPQSLGAVLIQLLRSSPLLVTSACFGMVIRATKKQGVRRVSRWFFPIWLVWGMVLAWGRGPGDLIWLELPLLYASASAWEAAWCTLNRGTRLWKRALIGSAVLILLGMTIRHHALLQPDPAATELQTLVGDIETLSAHRRGDPHEMDLAIQAGAAPDPLLGWYLREMRRLRWNRAPKSAGSATLLITSAADDALSQELAVDHIGSRYRIRPSGPADRRSSRVRLPGGFQPRYADRVILWVKIVSSDVK
ncbi:MAG: hypothetical protein ACE5ID_03815 [Acidobacteriota bacterium]